MKQYRISKILFALGMLLLCNPLLAQNSEGDSIRIDSLSQVTQEYSGKVQELAQTTSSHATILMILSAVLAVSVFMLILLTISKWKRLKSHYKNGNSPFEKEITEIRKRVEKLEEQIPKIEKDEEDIKNFRENLAALNDQIAKLQLKKDEKSNKENAQNQPAQKKTTSTVQYLKAGNDENFFYEGESSNSEGCQFRVQFHSKSNGSKAELTIITDIENLKAIPASFLKRVIHTKNNITIKEATSFTIIHSGTCEFKQDGDVGIWMIKRPIEVKLNK